MERFLDISKLKKVSVLGMGRSGLEVARFFRSKGIEVFISDSATADKLGGPISILEELDIKYETGGHSDKLIKGVDLSVISPGISLENQVVKDIEKAGVPIISELELAFELSKAPFIAITGTNGKSTTTSMIGHILSAGGFDVIIGGNIGIPLVEKAYEAGDENLIVAEVSSFQLETVDHFKPHISLLLNITSDHLNRHGTMDNYLNLKSRILKNQNEDDYVILNYDDPLIKSLENKTSAKVLYFSLNSCPRRGMFVRDNCIYYKNGDGEFEICHRDDVPLAGEHNLMNTMAAMMVAFIYGVKKEDIIKSLKDFKGLRHRLEFVSQIGGVDFIDDSKGTNPDAVIYALKSFNSPVVLIAGGVDKDMDFTGLCDEIVSRVKGLVLIGTTADELEKLCRERGFSNIKRAVSMDDAVEKSYDMSDDGDTVLLSPAGASFDMFRHAEERGEKFIEAVEKLNVRI